MRDVPTNQQPHHLLPTTWEGFRMLPSKSRPGTTRTTLPGTMTLRQKPKLSVAFSHVCPFFVDSQHQPTVASHAKPNGKEQGIGNHGGQLIFVGAYNDRVSCPSTKTRKLVVLMGHLYFQMYWMQENDRTCSLHHAGCRSASVPRRSGTPTSCWSNVTHQNTIQFPG
jgi:hypothetical protein